MMLMLMMIRLITVICDHLKLKIQFRSLGWHSRDLVRKIALMGARFIIIMQLFCHYYQWTPFFTIKFFFVLILSFEGVIGRGVRVRVLPWSRTKKKRRNSQVSVVIGK